MMSRRFAPSAFRRPISRVRSLTTISMMFMMTMPPTSSEGDDADEHGKDAVGGLGIESQDRVDDSRPKLSGSAGFSRRATRSATVASSMAASSTSGLDGFASRVSDCRGRTAACRRRAG